jgi:hypothetical protein
LRRSESESRYSDSNVQEARPTTSFSWAPSLERARETALPTLAQTRPGESGALTAPARTRKRRPAGIERPRQRRSRGALLPRHTGIDRLAMGTPARGAVARVAPALCLGVCSSPSSSRRCSSHELSTPSIASPSSLPPNAKITSTSVATRRTGSARPRRVVMRYAGTASGQIIINCHRIDQYSW